MPTSTDTDSGFILDNPASIAWFGFKAGINRVLLDKTSPGKNTKNLSIGVSDGFVIVFNTKSGNAYARWNLVDPATDKPATPEAIVKGAGLIRLAKLHGIKQIHNVSVK